MTHRSNSGMQLLGLTPGLWGKPADAAKYFRVQLGLTPDDVVGLFHEPVHQLGLLAVHHLVRTGRDDLHVGAHFLQLIEMRRSAEDRLVQGVLDVFVGGAGASATVRAAVGYQSGLVYVEFVRRGYVCVGVDDHICVGLMGGICARSRKRDYIDFGKERAKEML